MSVRVPGDRRAHDLTRAADGGWWVTSTSTHAFHIHRIDARGRLEPLGARAALNIPRAKPIATTHAPNGDLRVLANDRATGLVLLRISPSGHVERRQVAVADGDRGLPVISDAIWDEGKVVVVGHVGPGVRNPSSETQPAIGVIEDGTLTWRELRASGSWGALKAVAAYTSGTFVTTGAGGYTASGIRGYPLLSFTSDLELVPGTDSGVLVDPRENCQFQMADIAVSGQYNTTIGTLWGCDFAPEAFAVVAAQQYPSLLSHDSFGGEPGRSGEGAVRVLPRPGLDWRGRSIVVDSQGRLLLAGTALGTAAGMGWVGSPELTTPRPFTARLLADGSIDPSFAINALALLNSKWAWTVSDAAIDRLDRPVLLGTATSADGTELRLVRLLS